MNKTLTVALSMCAGVAIVGGVFAQPTGGATDRSTSTIDTRTRQAMIRQGDRLKPTEAQKTKMQATYRAVKDAIDANDYDAFQIAQATASGKFADKEVSTEQFAQMVSKNQARLAHKLAIEFAVKTNDFVAFVAAHDEMHDNKEANKPADAPQHDSNRPELSDEDKMEKLQARFDKLVEYYADNGEFPTMNKGHNKKATGYDKGHTGPKMRDKCNNER